MNIKKYVDHFNPDNKTLSFMYFQEPQIMPTSRPRITYDQTTLDFLSELGCQKEYLNSHYMKNMKKYMSDIEPLHQAIDTANKELVTSILTYILRVEQLKNASLIEWVESGLLYKVLLRLNEIN